MLGPVACAAFSGPGLGRVGLALGVARPAAGWPHGLPRSAPWRNLIRALTVSGALAGGALAMADGTLAGGTLAGGALAMADGTLAGGTLAGGALAGGAL